MWGSRGLSPFTRSTRLNLNFLSFEVVTTSQFCPPDTSYTQIQFAVYLNTTDCEQIQIQFQTHTNLPSTKDQKHNRPSCLWFRSWVSTS